MKRTIGIIVALVLMLALLAACGGAGNPGSAGQPQSGSLPLPAASASTGADASAPPAGAVGSAGLYGFGDDPAEARGNTLCNDANGGTAVLGDGLVFFRNRYEIKVYNPADGSVALIYPESDEQVSCLNYWQGRLYFCRHFSVWSCLPDGSDLKEHFPEVPVRYFYIIDGFFYIYSGADGEMVAIELADEGNINEIVIQPDDFTSMVTKTQMIVSDGYIYFCMDEYVTRDDDMYRAFPVYRYNIKTGEQEKVSRDFTGLLDFGVFGGKLAVVADGEEVGEMKTYVTGPDGGGEAVYDAHLISPVMAGGELFDQLGSALLRDPLGEAEEMTKPLGGAYAIAVVGEYIYYGAVDQTQYLFKYDGSETIELT